MAGRGGKRTGAGRPAGSGWKPARRALSDRELRRRAEIIDHQDPLSVVVSFACDPMLDVSTRLSAASIALPYLYPRLSATQVNARVTTTTVDASVIMEKLTARLEKIAAPAEPTPPIKVTGGDEKD